MFLSFFSRWFCHFDDDNYVNIPALVKKLREFDHRQDWYLGKPSISEPLEILDRGDNIQVCVLNEMTNLFGVTSSMHTH